MSGPKITSLTIAKDDAGNWAGTLVFESEASGEKHSITGHAPWPQFTFLIEGRICRVEFPWMDADGSITSAPQAASVHRMPEPGWLCVCGCSIEHHPNKGPCSNSACFGRTSYPEAKRCAGFSGAAVGSPSRRD